MLQLAAFSVFLVLRLRSRPLGYLLLVVCLALLWPLVVGGRAVHKAVREEHRMHTVKVVINDVEEPPACVGVQTKPETPRQGLKC